MAQPHCCCRLKEAEINGIVASRCVWWPPSLHEIISCLHMMSLSTSCSSHVPFERSGHTWTKFQTRCNCQCNLWKRREMPVSHKLSEASRLNSLFCLCLIPKLSKAMAQPHCCCRLKQAEINGIVASRCVWRPPSLHEIISCWHMMSLSTSCSSHVPFERSGHTRTKFQTHLQTSKWSASYARCSKGYFVRLYALSLRTMPIWDWGVSRAAACTIRSSQFLLRDSEMPEILDLLDFALGPRQLRICRKLQELEGIA